MISAVFAARFYVPPERPENAGREVEIFYRSSQRLGAAANAAAARRGLRDYLHAVTGVDMTAAEYIAANASILATRRAPRSLSMMFYNH